jgi:signal peptidase I
LKITKQPKKKLAVKQLLPITTAQYKKRIKELLFLVLLILSISVIFSFKTHVVRGNSMYPTLANKDRILVKKSSQPKRYDLITFDPLMSKEKSYVKRVAAVPGDQLWTQGDAVYLRPQKAGKWVLNTAEQLTAEELPDSTLKVIVSPEVFQKLRNLHKIPENCYFVLGDNRSASKDSRTMGLIQAKQIEGIVLWRYYPFDSMGLIH